MQDLIASLAAEFGLTQQKARGALGVLLKLIEQHADPQDVERLLSALPGAEQLLMATAAELQKQGVGLNQIRGFLTAFAEHAEAKVGRDVVERIASAIPGLDELRS